MHKDFHNNQSLIDLSAANSTNTSLSARPQLHQPILRRKMPNLPLNERRRKSGADQQTIAVRYIPLTRAATQENSISLPISRQSSKENLHTEPNETSTRRFQRHSERVFNHFKSPDIHPEPEICNAETCIEERNKLTQNIRKITAKNERLEKENERLLGQIRDGEERIRKLEDQNREKNLKMEELGTLLAKREATCNKMHESINEKYRQISKLEDMVYKLQKQIMSSSNPQTFTPLSLESSRIINQLTSQLKYREMENHMLKKEQFDTYALEEQIKAISKENTLLKDRLTYYIRNCRNIDAESCSSDSFSLSFSQTSPLKRSGRLKMDNI